MGCFNAQKTNKSFRFPGQIKKFTGIDQEYQIPKKSDLSVKTENLTIEESASTVIDFLEKKKIIPILAKPWTPIKELFIPESRIKSAKSEAEKLSSLEISEIEVQWLQVLAEGWADPLNGFMKEDQYLQVNNRFSKFGSVFIRIKFAIEYNFFPIEFIAMLLVSLCPRISLAINHGRKNIWTEPKPAGSVPK